MPALGFPLAGPLGGGGAGVPVILPQPDIGALQYMDATLAALPESDTGTDVSVLGALDGSWPVLGGDPMMAEQLLRRITTERGQLDFSPNDGIDVREDVREDMGADDVFQVKQRIENEVLKDDRADDVAVQSTFFPDTQTLEHSIVVTKATGGFRLVLAVTALSVNLLSAEVV